MQEQHLTAEDQPIAAFRGLDTLSRHLESLVSIRRAWEGDEIVAETEQLTPSSIQPFQTSWVSWAQREPLHKLTA